MFPESYRHYSVVAVHGWDICRVVAGLPGETPDGLAGRRAPKSDMEDGRRRRGEDSGPARHWRRRLSFRIQSGRGLTGKGSPRPRRAPDPGSEECGVEKST